MPSTVYGAQSRANEVIERIAAANESLLAPKLMKLTMSGKSRQDDSPHLVCSGLAWRGPPNLATTGRRFEPMSSVSLFGHRGPTSGPVLRRPSGDRYPLIANNARRAGSNAPLQSGRRSGLRRELATNNARSSSVHSAATWCRVCGTRKLWLPGFERFSPF